METILSLMRQIEENWLGTKLTLHFWSDNKGYVSYENDFRMLNGTLFRFVGRDDLLLKLTNHLDSIRFYGDKR